MEVVNEYEGKTILVTGGAGCIGTNLCKKLAELNAKKVLEKLYQKNHTFLVQVLSLERKCYEDNRRNSML